LISKKKEEIEEPKKIEIKLKQEEEKKDESSTE